VDKGWTGLWFGGQRRHMPERAGVSRKCGFVIPGAVFDGSVVSLLQSLGLSVVSATDLSGILSDLTRSSLFPFFFLFF